MACHVHTAPDLKLIPPPSPRCRFLSHPSGLLLPPRRRLRPLAAARGSADAAARRRDLLLLPPLAVGTGLLLSAAAAWGAEEKPAPAPSSAPASPLPPPAPAEEKKKKEEVKAEISSRVYDATAIGEPQALGKDKGKVWEKLLGARVVYMGEAETVPDRDDRALELEIVRTLRDRCFEQQRPVSLALEIFPSDQQDKLNLFMSKRIDGEVLRSYNPQWPSQLWQEYEPLLNYCRDNGVRLVACGTPLEVLRTVQSEGIRGLPKAQRKIYAPPVGSGVTSGFVSLSGQPSTDKFSSNQSVPFAPYAYLSAQTRAVDDYAMSQVILNAMNDGGSVGMLLVITGASHVIYGSRGIGIPARISKKLQKKNQAVILLDPERQHIRREGEAPVADFLWYSAAKPCNRNCFDRAEISRVMNAAGRRRDALPQDLQDGLDLGLVSPEILQNFFDLEQYPFVSELIHRFQGFRERLLVDPKFLHRLAIEEAISISTTLLAQYERRKERFFEEIDYVITDTLRGSVVDFFTVWLPAPTISFLSSSSDINVPEKMEVIKGFLGSIPDNAFQKVAAGRNWDLNQRFASVIVGGLKLAGVGFVSSLGAGSASSILYGLRRFVNPGTSPSKQKKATPLLKSAVVYACFLGTSANLRYQVIAGIVEHRISDELLSYYNLPILVNAISFVVRTINSYWGTQQWVDLARLTGLQPRKLIATDQLSGGSETPGLQPQKPITTTDHLPGGSEAPLACNTEANVLDDINSQSGDPSP